MSEKKETAYFDAANKDQAALVEKMGWKVQQHVDRTPIVDRRAVKR